MSLVYKNHRIYAVSDYTFSGSGLHDVLINNANKEHVCIIRNNLVRKYHDKRLCPVFLYFNSSYMSLV